MLILSETVPPPPGRQITDDDGDNYSGREKLRDEDRWVEQFVQRLTEALRRIGRGK
jgi:hypothetical protein